MLAIQLFFLLQFNAVVDISRVSANTIVKVKANAVTVCRFIKNQSSCFLCHIKILLFLIAAVHIVVDKGGVIAVNGVGCVEKYRFQILLDVADFRGVLFHAVKDKFMWLLLSFINFALTSSAG